SPRSACPHASIVVALAAGQRLGRSADAEQRTGRRASMTRLPADVVAWVVVGASCTGAAATSAPPSTSPPPTTNPSKEAPRPTPAATHHVTTQVALVTAELRNELVVVSVPG